MTEPTTAPPLPYCQQCGKSCELHCRVTVYRADTYRRTGRGKTGFEMHYTSGRCQRKAGDTGYCWQHAWKGRLHG
jgi:hypothetical protein